MAKVSIMETMVKAAPRRRGSCVPIGVEEERGGGEGGGGSVGIWFGFGCWEPWKEKRWIHTIKVVATLGSSSSSSSSMPSSSSRNG